jgi:hypothetical protein
MDIIKRQPWMVHEDRLWRHTGAEFAQNQLYRNACATNYRFTTHDVRVHFDAFVLQGILFDRFRPQYIMEDPVCQRSVQPSLFYHLYHRLHKPRRVLTELTHDLIVVRLLDGHGLQAIFR